MEILCLGTNSGLLFHLSPNPTKRPRSHGPRLYDLQEFEVPNPVCPPFIDIATCAGLFMYRVLVESPSVFNYLITFSIDGSLRFLLLKHSENAGYDIISIKYIQLQFLNYDESRLFSVG
eukprot:Gregarina_sp_Poly_1__6519@NODE_3496_length_1055_cov_83_801619_g2216_i0_p1_GENE_NODE_3496_length_1055_cov_83_801619_g2216_i0NODE_3496_length_1055_cov_83_801619_g2216_i0_p1_ORF_typecomplete_len119_score3_00_NODE_3496_length_1055_cov_83_801619_g2216_i0263619